MSYLPEVSQQSIELARRVLSLIDLTSLADTDTDAGISMLCDKALAGPVAVAAVCIYPRFVKIAAEKLKGSSIKIATVANFPEGNHTPEIIFAVIAQGIQNGADEIDVVFPYELFLRGGASEAKKFIRDCKTQCGNGILLKVILETGALPLERIAEATCDVIDAGADFVKTSTGKIKVGATLEAATIILTNIKKMMVTQQRVIGFKVSGGVRTLEQAAEYLALADSIMGKDWVNPQTFRFGASQLFDAVAASFDK